MTERLINRSISVLYRYNQRFFSQALNECRLPLKVGQIPSLMQVYRNPGITQDKISSFAGIDKGTVARTLKQLENSGHVVRETDENDRRVNHIFLTPKGMETIEQVIEIIDQLHKILYCGFDDSEIDTAISLLERMKSNIIGELSG